MKEILSIIIFVILVGGAGAVAYKEAIGPWTVEFRCSQNLSFQKQAGEPDETGNTINALYFNDAAGHMLGWFTMMSYNILMKASEENFDNILDSYAKSLKITAPVKTSLEVAGTLGRMEEGYSSEYSRKWRAVSWAYKPFFDSFTNTNMTKHYITLNSIQEEKDFREILGSVNVSFVNA